jgi:hypothetical protein
MSIQCLIRATYFVFQMQQLKRRTSISESKAKVITIIGASIGIGEAIALLLTERGQPCIKGAGSDRLEALANRIAAAGGEAAVQLDSSQSSRTGTRAGCSQFPIPSGLCYCCGSLNSFCGCTDTSVTRSGWESIGTWLLSTALLLNAPRPHPSGSPGARRRGKCGEKHGKKKP